jgi:succinyl-diaminopimelate desuccinylase
MKAGLAAMLFATDAVIRSGSFPGRIVVAALVDEEGMMTGVRDFVARGRAEGIDGAICCEPEGGEICHTAKGALRLRIDLHGRMAHGAMPFEGRNPNRAAAAVIAALGDVEDRLQDRHGVHEHLGEAWITPTVLRAGEPAQMNVMPASASLWVDLRTIPSIDHGTLIDDVGKVVASAADPFEVGTVVDVIDDRPPIELAEDDPLVRAVWDAHAAVASTPPRLGGVPGTTDGTLLTALGDVPSVVYGPGGKWIAHQADEFVEVVDLVEHANVYVEAARRFLDGEPSR